MSENNQDFNQLDAWGRITAALDVYKKQIALGAGAILLVALGFSLYAYVDKQQELEASEKLYTLKVQFTLIDSKENFEKEKVREAFRNFIQENENTAAAKEAALEMASYFDKNKMFKEANEVLKMIKKRQEPIIMDLLYRYRLAMSYQKIDQCDKALPIYKELSQNKEFSYINAPSLLQKGLCLEKMGKTQEAKNTYENLSSTYGDTEVGKKAEKYLILMNLGA